MKQDNLLTVSDLTISYPIDGGKIFTALKNISIEVRKGQVVGVVGESGAGKSTIGKTALGILDEVAMVTSGEILFEGKNISALNEDEYLSIRGKKIGYIYQNPMTALNPVLTIGEQIIETIEANTEIKGEAAWNYAIELLEQAEISFAKDRMSKYPHQLSGGLCQRIVFAIAISAKPNLIIADEPTTALDVTVQKSVLQTLKNLALKNNIAIILITHDMGVISEMCDYVYVMRFGEVVEHGTKKKIFNNPEKKYTQELIASIPRVDKKIHRFQVPGLGNLKNRTDALKYLMARNTYNHQKLDEPLLEVNNISKLFITKGGMFKKTESFQALNNISLKVFRGKTLGIVGESGSGKSTVGRIILGLHQPEKGGEIFYKGKNIAKITSRKERLEHCLSLQCIFQDPYSSLNPRMTAGDNITYALRAHNFLTKAEAEKLAGDLMELVGLKREAAAKKPSAFSGGERQRIGIARALSFRPDFIFCDEPTSALDVTVQAELLNLLKDLQETLSLTLLFVSHDLAVVRQMCDDVIVMKDGNLMEEGTCDEVLVNPKMKYTRQLLDAMPKLSFN